MNKQEAKKVMKPMRKVEWVQKRKSLSRNSKLSKPEKERKGTGKRMHDAVDLESIEKQTTQRSRFTQKERDMVH